MAELDLSIVVPAYNEAARIRPTLEALLAFLDTRHLAAEIIIVDDGSSDTTDDVVAGVQDARIRLIRLAHNQGKGAAIRAGVLASRGSLVLFTDADLSTPMTEFEKLKAAIDNGADVAIGSRALSDSQVEPQPWWRRWIGILGNIIIQLVLDLPIHDTQCGFKLFRRAAAMDLFNDLRMRRFSFDYEILYKARQKNYRIQEVGVAWKHKPGSKVRPQDVGRCLIDVFVIRFRSMAFRFSWNDAAVCGTAAIVALLVAAPLIAFPFYAGARFAGINIPQFGDDEHYYLSRGKEMAEGHGLGQPFLSEGKGAQDPTFSSAERGILLPVTLLQQGSRLDVVTYYNIANGIGVFLLALIMYAFAYALSGSRLLALGSMFFAICGYSIVYNKTLFYNDFNIYGRSLFPYVSSIPFFAFLCALYQRLVKEKNDVYAVVAALLAGFLFYVYFYAWTFAYAVLGSLFIIYMALRKWRQVRDMVAISLVGIVLGSPVLYGLFTYFKSPASSQVAYFLFESHGHQPIMSIVGLATLVLFSGYWYVRRAAPENPFILGLILAGWVAVNQQILTGRFVQYGHYYWYFVVPLSIIIAAYLLWRLIPQRYRIVLPIALIMLAFINTLGGQYKSFWTTAEDKLREQDFAPILARLNQLPQGSVFMGASGDTYPFLITIYTKDDLYWLSAAELFSFPPDRLEETLLVHMYLNPTSRKDPMGFLKTELAEGKMDTYTNLYSELEGSRTGLDYYDYQKRKSNSGDQVITPIRESLLAELAATYVRTFPSTKSIRALLLNHGVRYIVWDKQQYPEFDLSVLSPLTLMASSTDLELYEMRPMSSH